MSDEGIASESRALWMLFTATVDSLLKLGGPRAGFLDDSLINGTIARQGAATELLLEIEAKLHQLLDQTREAHLELLDALFVILWRRIDHPLTSADLATRGFDDEAEPRLHDYIDDM